MLNGCAITDEDYEHAQNVWKHFGIEGFGDYHDCILKLTY